MATSRDDFVIAIRSAFIKKGNKQRFSLIGLIFFCIILIILSNLNFYGIKYLKNFLNEIVYRVSFVVSLPEQQINLASIKIKSHMQMYDDYDSLKNKFNKLQGLNHNTNFLISENERLRKLIDEYIVNSDENSPFLKSIIVNKGSKDNIKIGMAVLDGVYLVGKIVEVNYSTSRVLLISDLNSKVPVILEPGNIQSIMTGTGQKSGKIQYLKKDILLNDNDRIVFTSGSGGIFKAGIPIGKLFSDNKIEYFSDLSQLAFVKLVAFEKINN